MAQINWFAWLLLYVLLALPVKAQYTPELYKKNQSATYEECMAFYNQMAKQYEQAQLVHAGQSSNGLPIGLLIIDKDLEFSAEKSHARGKIVLLINNGIHPGEPDGIDASMLFVKELLQQKKHQHLLDRITFCIVPVYNADGAMNRSCCSRVNQDGPKEYGFRANDQYLDLNRDFIKMDSENARTFASLFQDWNPDVFIDTHVSNGADYSYNMTLITTQRDKLAPDLGMLVKNSLEPFVYNWMKSKNDPIAPYINTEKWSYPPDSGLYAFLESPRYATGYTALFHSIGFVTETHMLKPFPIRVESTLQIIKGISEMCVRYSKEILLSRHNSSHAYREMEWIPLSWKVDLSQHSMIDFAGYEAAYKHSNISGHDRLYYNRNKPYVKKIRYYDTCMSVDSVMKPLAYIIPQAWINIISKLQQNKTPLIEFENDTTMWVDVYKITDYKTTDNPYEGHYAHYQTETNSQSVLMNFRKGDVWIPMGTTHDRFVCEVLEPRAPDSYFNWGFFDAILQQKEWYSDYVFEDLAEEILAEDTVLKNEFQFKLSNDSVFRNDPFSRLYYIYSRSKYFEKGYRRYPVYKFMGKLE